MENFEETPIPVLTTPQQAQGWLAGVGTPPSLCLDLEADGLHRYEDKICLAQVEALGETVLIDPVGDRAALAPLRRLVEDPGVLKILHGADYDVRLMKKDAGWMPVNLFDTMIASQLLGRKQVGLAAVLEAEFGVTLDKACQKADWSKRPLTDVMIRYAALDVKYLAELHQRLAAELERLGRTAWAREEFLLLAKAEPPPPKKPWCLDVKGAGTLAPRELAALQALLEVRDAWARAWDRPPFKVLPPDLLLAWAKAPPDSRRKIVDSPGASKGTLAKLADELLDALKRAAASPPESWPRRPTLPPRALPTEAEKLRLKKLKEAREAVAQGLGIEPGLLINGASLERVARLEGDEARAELGGLLKDWQREAAGEALEAALRG